MKPAQWMAVLVLALMVGGISFVSVYLGGTSRSGNIPTVESSASLTFPIKVFPQEGEPEQTTEVHQQGYRDFWFANESGKDVTVGLNSKGCTCSEVELTIAPGSWQPYLVRLAGMSALEGHQRNLANLVTLAATWNRELRELDKLDGGGSSTMLTLDNSATVPAGAFGRVRLSWHQDASRRLPTYADLWMGQRGGAANARLEAHVFISSPMDVSQREVTLPAVGERDLEKKPEGQRAWLICFSVTRRAFDLKARVLHEHIKPESDPIEVGDPVPLTLPELPRNEDAASGRMLIALSGYRIPLRVRARARDGTPIEWGHFRRVVQLSSSDAGIEPIQVTVTGQVRGVVTAGEGKGSGMINLGPFRTSHGAHGSIVLRSDEKGIELELDKPRIPNYLKATLDKPRETESGHRSWVLRVEVEPGAMDGEFPNPNNPVYRDSAIYVKTKGDKSQTPHRSLRIPVLGVANAS